MHVCEPAFDAVVVEREPLVVDAQQVKCGGMEVIGISGLVSRFPPQFVSGSIADSALDASSGHPSGEGAGIVVVS